MMPTYCYRCEHCGNSFERILPSKKRNEQRCSCGKKLQRDIPRELQDNEFNLLEVDNPRWSDALGVHPNQVPGILKEHPDRVYDREGRLLIKNRKHKLQLLREIGWAELA